MAQNNGEENKTKDSAEQPTNADSQSEQGVKAQSQSASASDTKQGDKADKAAQALAQLEADLKSAQAEQPAEKQTQAEANKAEPRAKKTKPQSAIKPNKAEAAATNTIVKVRSKLAILAFLLSLGALGAAGFIWWQNQLWLKNQEQMEQIKQQALLTTQQTLNQQQAQITDLLSKLSAEQNQQQVLQQSLQSMQARIQELGASQPNYWLAAEARYLIQLAERRIVVEGDPDTAMQLLLDANSRLAAMQDPSVFHIRTAISEDIAMLKAVVKPNADDVYLSLSGLLSQVETLPFAQVYVPEVTEQAEKAEQVTENIDDWQHNLAVSAKRFFANYVTIRRQETQLQPQLPADQQWFVRANLTTEFLMAQSAVLDHSQARYSDSLTRIKKWALQYFDQNKPEVVAFVTNIEHLAQQNVELVLPSELAAQPLIANYVIEQLKLKEQSHD